MTGGGTCISLADVKRHMDAVKGKGVGGRTQTAETHQETWLRLFHAVVIAFPPPLDRGTRAIGHLEGDPLPLSSHSDCVSAPRAML